MRFMMITKGHEQANSDMPDAEGAAAMMKYMEALEQAGILVAFDGLRSTALGARVSFPEGKAVVTDGPFAEAKEIIGGYWMIEVKSKQEAVEWAMRCPAFPDLAIEIRQVTEFSDFPADVRRAAAIFPRLKARCVNHPGT